MGFCSSIRFEKREEKESSVTTVRIGIHVLLDLSHSNNFTIYTSRVASILYFAFSVSHYPASIFSCYSVVGRKYIYFTLLKQCSSVYLLCMLAAISETLRLTQIILRRRTESSSIFAEFGMLVMPDLKSTRSPSFRLFFFFFLFHPLSLAWQPELSVLVLGRKDEGYKVLVRKCISNILSSSSEA